MNSLRGRITNRQITQRFVQRLQSLKLRSGSTATSNVSSASNNETEFNIPFRKERSSTDILHALEKTISRDPTAPHYKYHDDPLLSPISNRGKRTFALAKEAGRKAAMWILAEHSELFNHRISEPEIKQFLPKARYEKKEDVSEELLLNMIREGSVTDSLTVYKLLENEASIECKQALLELLCYHNNQEQLADDLIEERWYRKAANRQRQIWKSSPELEELFEFLKNQDKPIAAAAYNALICGTAKYMKVDRAWGLFEECQKKNIPLCLETYNHLIQLVPVLRDGPNERKTLLIEFLNEINQVGLVPNVATLNSALRVVTAIAVHIQKFGKELARTLFTDFKKFGVEPSLASYYFALLIFCRDRGPRCKVLREIIDELEGKTFTMHDASDTFFFVTAMDVARNHLNDHLLAGRIHKLLLTGKNYDFIGEGFKESIYYRHYTLVHLKNLPFDEFMQLYDMMVPNIYVPEPSVMEEIIDALKLADDTIARDVLPRLWSHMIMFEHLDRDRLVTKSIAIMRNLGSASEDSPLNEQFAEAVWSYWNYVKDQSDHRMQRISWSGKVLADMAILSFRGNHFDRFLEITELMAKESNSIIGTADIEQLDIMFEACLERGHPIGAFNVLRYSAEAGFEESIAMGAKIQANIPLSPDQQLQLTALIGSQVPKAKSTSDDKIEN